ncbi:hypothetical protein [Agrobacterium sp. 10MFCol1.1]|uniref:hypothetical protein n=1 Tax=Agrobacterium sp. 10MFCol1.1 TaxID=1150775 RepID=UPI0003807227|nr:hypothetical protein [Agrobacterium sp. 10MFCol1.1]
MDISHIIETIKAVPAPPSPPELEAALPPLPALQLSEVGRAARSERKLTVFAGAAALTVGGYLALFVHGFWGTALCVGALVMTALSVSLKRKFEVEYRDAEAKWDEQRQTWLTQAGPAKFEEKRRLFLSLAGTYSGLPAKERELLGELEKAKRERQFTNYMKSHLIERAKIPGVGQSRKATLASNGFTNALDVKNRRVPKLPGFGPSLVGEVEAWASSVGQRFAFNPTAPTEPHLVQQVKSTISMERVGLEQKLANAPDQLKSVCESAERLRNAPPQTMYDALVRLKQIEVDRG